MPISSLFSTSPLILNDDLLLINRGGTSYQIEASKLVDANDDDKLLVNRGGVSYQINAVDIENALDTDIVLVNRGGVSYHATVGELRGVLSVPITFTVEIRTPKKDFNKGNSNNNNPWCNSPQSGSQNGGKLRATVTAKTLQTFNFDKGTLYIDGEWVMCCGSNGETGFKNEWRKDYYDYISNPPKYNWLTCHFYYLGQSSKGLAAVGTGGTPRAGSASKSWENGSTAHNDSGSYGNSGAGGFGCPPGNQGAAGNGGQSSGGGAGNSQTRPRAENSGDTFNEVTVENPVHSTGNWGGDAYIQKDGVTLRGSGVIGELLNTDS